MRGGVKSGGLKLGLRLNESKCELITHGGMQILPTAMSSFQQTAPEEAMLLGTPLSSAKALDDCLQTRVNKFLMAGAKLKLLHTHDALILLRHSLSVPRLLHNLRSTYCGSHALLAQFDALQRDYLSNILNVDMSDSQWSQAALPVKDGGLGLRQACNLAPSAFLSSLAASLSLVNSILPRGMSASNCVLRQRALSDWLSLSGSSAPTGELAHSQRNWDGPLRVAVQQHLMRTASDDYTRARLLAAASPHSGEWLNAPPISAIGLRMEDSIIRVAAGLRLGSVLCAPHTCYCGAQVDARGNHGLACKKSAGRSLRHSLLNDIIHRSLGRAQIAAVKEPAGLSLGSGRRPDGATLIPWVRGKCLAWDATTPDTLAASHIGNTSTTSGAAASHAASRKKEKYRDLNDTYLFVPVAVETLGSWDAEGLSFIKELGRRISGVTHDARETSFLLQRLSVAVQRGNAASVLGTLSADVSVTEA